MLSLSLDTGLESFLHWSMALSTMVSLKSAETLNQSLLQFRQVACCCCALLYGAVVAIETMHLTLNLYQACQMQSIQN